MTLTAEELADRTNEFPPDRFDFYWSSDWRHVEVVALRWWDEASYAEYQGDPLHTLNTKGDSMDPNAAWAEALRAHQAQEPEAFAEACASLCHWLERGGFPPRITGILALDRMMAQAVCAFASSSFPDS